MSNNDNKVKTVAPHLEVEWVPNQRREFQDLTKGSHFRGVWRCGEGHTWEATVKDRVRGYGCPYCARLKCLPGFNDLATTHPDVASEWSSRNEVTPDTVLCGSTRKFWWRCVQGHEWESTPVNRVKPRGCPVCSGKKVLLGVNDLQTTHPILAGQWGGGNTKLPTHVTFGSSYRAQWICPEGHQWTAVVSSRAGGRGCPVCSGRKTVPGVNDFASKQPEMLKEWSPRNSENPSEVSEYSSTRYWWVCSERHEWFSKPADRVGYGTGCKVCNTAGVSRAERGFSEEVSSWGLETRTSHRRIDPRFEFDVTIPERKIAIEYNGLYWHTETKKGQLYHLNKTLAAHDAGWSVLHVWEDDWRDRREVVEKMLKRKLGVSDEPRLNARNLEVRQVSPSQARDFLEANHIQGFTGGSWRGGLFSGDELVALMVMRSRGSDTYELARFATSAIVRGGFSKLLKAFIREHRPKSIVTFADRGVSDGGLYEKNGFTKDGELKPDYTYLVKSKREHKFNYRLKRFREDPKLKYVEGATERDLAELNGMERIYDAGKVRWVLRPQYDRMD